MSLPTFFVTTYICYQLFMTRIFCDHNHSQPIFMTKFLQLEFHNHTHLQPSFIRIPVTPNRSLPFSTLLAVSWQMCHVWLTAWNVTGSFLVTGTPSYLKQNLPSFMFLGYLWLFYNAWNTIWMSSRVIPTKPDYVTHGTMCHM